MKNLKRKTRTKRTKSPINKYPKTLRISRLQNHIENLKILKNLIRIRIKKKRRIKILIENKRSNQKKI
jgi:hypothetical protein